MGVGAVVVSCSLKDCGFSVLYFVLLLVSRRGNIYANVPIYSVRFTLAYVGQPCRDRYIIVAVYFHATLCSVL